MTAVEARHRVAIAGRVADAVTGEPVPGAAVRLDIAPAAVRRAVAAADLVTPAPGRRPDRAVSDADGRFLLMDLPAGSYRLAVDPPGGDGRYGAATASVRVAAGGPAKAEVALPPTALAVTVRGPDGPVAGARVRVRGSGLGATTGADGTCTLAGLQPGPHVAAVEARGLAPATQAVTVARAGATARATVTLSVE